MVHTLSKTKEYLVSLSYCKINSNLLWFWVEVNTLCMRKKMYWRLVQSAEYWNFFVVKTIHKLQSKTWPPLFICAVKSSEIYSVLGATAGVSPNLTPQISDEINLFCAKKKPLMWTRRHSNFYRARFIPSTRRRQFISGKKANQQVWLGTENLSVTTLESWQFLGHC